MLVCITFLNILFLVLLALFKTAGIGKHAVALPLALIGLLGFLLTEKKGLEFICKRLDARYGLCVLYESVKQSGNLCNV